MDAFLKLSREDQQLYCEQAESRLNIPPASIEKDFWVCWTLRELFTLDGISSYLTFKGGTSLSKGWQLIERFSEDIDIVIDRDLLGFRGAQLLEEIPSKKQQKLWLERLKKACQLNIAETIEPALRRRFSAAVPGSMTWTLELAAATDDPDMQTLLFHYPSVFAGAASYVSPLVRIEMGARSDTDPRETPEISPYLAEVFPTVMGARAFVVRAVAARRTFWEKVMLLHEENHRPMSKPLKRQLARHYYDLWCLIRKGIAAEAIADPGLFDRVARHRELYFRWTWMDYSTLRPGSLRLVPLEGRLPEWRRDYEAMTEMFFGNPPDFSEVMEAVGEFEREFNQSGVIADT